MNDNEKAQSEADTRTFVALLLIVVVATMLLGVMALVLRPLLGVVLVVGGIALFAVMHYVVWGWWLGGYLRRQAERDTEPLSRRQVSGDRTKQEE